MHKQIIIESLSLAHTHTLVLNSYSHNTNATLADNVDTNENNVKEEIRSVCDHCLVYVEPFRFSAFVLHYFSVFLFILLCVSVWLPCYHHCMRVRLCVCWFVCDFFFFLVLCSLTSFGLFLFDDPNDSFAQHMLVFSE